jgi:hypothetical protein
MTIPDIITTHLSGPAPVRLTGKLNGQPFAFRAAGHGWHFLVDYPSSCTSSRAMPAQFQLEGDYGLVGNAAADNMPQSEAYALVVACAQHMHRHTDLLNTMALWRPCREPQHQPAAPVRPNSPKLLCLSEQARDLLRHLRPGGAVYGEVLYNVPDADTILYFTQPTTQQSRSKIVLATLAELMALNLATFHSVYSALREYRITGAGQAALKQPVVVIPNDFSRVEATIDDAVQRP